MNSRVVDVRTYRERFQQSPLRAVALPFAWMFACVQQCGVIAVQQGVATVSTQKNYRN